MNDSLSVALVGPVGSGKTQFAELLYLTFADLTSKGELEGTLNIPVTINIMELVDDLISRGLGPRKTQVTKEVAEAYIEIRFKGALWRSKNIKIPIADLSGETLKAFMTGVLGDQYFDDDQKKAFLSRQAVSTENFKLITESILNAPILILCANLAFLEDPNSKPADAPAPDPALGTFLSSLVKFKQENAVSPKPRGLAIVLTHYDSWVKTALKSKGFVFESNAKGNDSLAKYFQTRMLSTNSQLEYLKRNWNVEVQYYFSGCEPEVDANDKPIFDADRQRFKINPATSRPFYHADQYEALTHWVKGLLS